MASGNILEDLAEVLKVPRQHENRLIWWWPRRYWQLKNFSKLSSHWKNLASREKRTVVEIDSALLLSTVQEKVGANAPENEAIRNILLDKAMVQQILDDSRYLKGCKRLFFDTLTKTSHGRVRIPDDCGNYGFGELRNRTEKNDRPAQLQPRYMPSSEAEKKALTVLPVIHTVTALVLDAFSERLQSSFEEATGDNTVCQEEDEVEVFNDVVSFPGQKAVVSHKLGGILLYVCNNPECKKVEPKKGSFKICGKCRNAHYCCRECQVVDWKKSHKSECFQRTK